MKRTCSHLHAEDYKLDCTSQLAYLIVTAPPKTDTFAHNPLEEDLLPFFFSSIPPSSDSLSQTQSPHSEHRDSAGGSRLDTGGFWRSPSRAAAECALSNQTINQSINSDQSIAGSQQGARRLFLIRLLEPISLNMPQKVDLKDWSTRFAANVAFARSTLSMTTWSLTDGNTFAFGEENGEGHASLFMTRCCCWDTLSN